MEYSTPNKEYHPDHAIVYGCQYHLVFCPKYRRKVLTPEQQVRFKELVDEKQDENGYQELGMEVMTDHVHLLLDVDPRQGIHQVVGRIKGYTAHALRREYPWLKSRLPSLWTRSKFISTVGSVSLGEVQEYIEEQKGR